MVRVAAVQYEPALGRKDANIAALLRLTREAGQAGASLAVLPEMGTTGYMFVDRSEIAPFVEPVPGPTTDRFGALAREFGLTVVLGLPEVDPGTGAYYNTAVVIDPRGAVAGKYRKTHSFHCDTAWAAEGNLGLPVFDGQGRWPGPLGLLICMDAGFFEPARVLALGGARLLAFPANWLRRSPHPEWRARAAENGVFLVAANRWGEERGTAFAGGSCVIGPRGEVLAELQRGDGVVLADIDLASCDQARSALDGVVTRQPYLYHGLLTHPYLWPERFRFGGLAAGPFRLGAVATRASKRSETVEPAGPSGIFGLVEAALGRSPAGEGPVILALPPLAWIEAGDLASAATGHNGLYLAGAYGNDQTVVLAGPEGILATYTSPHRRAQSVTPSLLATIDLPFARVGLLHATDLLLPEAPRLLAKAGADIVLAAGTWPPGFDDLRFLWEERADTNDVWLAVATDRGAGAYAGALGREKVEPEVGEGAGGLVVYGLAAHTGPGGFSRRKDRARRLRPELYCSLVAPEPTGASPTR